MSIAANSIYFNASMSMKSLKVDSISSFDACVGFSGVVVAMAALVEEFGELMTAGGVAMTGAVTPAVFSPGLSPSHEQE